MTPLLPASRAVRLLAVTMERAVVVLQLMTTAHAAGRPRGAALSPSVHSRYQRRPAELPWGTCPGHLRLSVRQASGRKLSCPRRIFTERGPELVAA
jgi:hypothetical protein